MKQLKKCLLALSLCVFITYSAVSQTNEIRITFIGNCGLHLTDGTTNIYTDFPYKSGAHNYMEFDESEMDKIKENSIFIFTHKHSDHYSAKNMRKVLKEKGGEKYGAWNIEELKALSNSIPDFKVEAFKTKHSWSMNHYSYLITWHGKKIYLSGDTESAETIATVEDIDWAFVPYWIMTDAKEKDIELDAKMFGIYHLAAVQVPSAKENWAAIEDIHPVTEQGEVISIKY